MPSTHSTALAFYFTYMWPLLPLLPQVSQHIWVERAAVTAIASLTLWSRVELGYHTVAQVLGGTSVGVVCALAWRGIWDAYPAIGTGLQAAIDGVLSVLFSFM